MGPIIQVTIPDGMGEIMESLTRAILKNQPNDIYGFAVTHFESLLKLRQAQSSGLSPSPTEEAGQKAPSGQEAQVEEEFKSSVNEEKPSEEPESNDTSYGVEATAVRTLAASTGTVAILGTTAKVKESNEPSVGDLKNPQIEPGENYQKESISDTAPQNENVEIVSSQMQDASDNDSIKAPTEHRHEQVEEKVSANTEDDILPQPSEEKRDEEKREEDKIVIATEEPKFMQESTEEFSATEEINVDEVQNVPAALEKNPVRIVDFQEKKDRVHEPKIVEEMSVKKDEKLNKSTDSEEMAIKHEKELVVISSIDKQGIEDEIIEPSKKPIEEEKSSAAEIEITAEDIKVTPGSEPGSPEASKTEDNEISSEQLKTNSLSDMSLSEAFNSEGEEAAREAAKAQELKEMVASLSATANRATLEYEISEDSSSSKDTFGNDVAAGKSSRDLEALEPTMSEPSKTDKVPEKFNENLISEASEVSELNVQHTEPNAHNQTPTLTITETSEEPSSEHSSETETPSQRPTVTIPEISEEFSSEHSSEPESQCQTTSATNLETTEEISIEQSSESEPKSQQTNVQIPETFEQIIDQHSSEQESIDDANHETAPETTSLSKDIEEEKDSHEPEDEGILATSDKTMKHKKTEGDNVEEKEKDETEIELSSIQNIQIEATEPTVTKMDILSEEKEVQQNEVEQTDDITEQSEPKEDLQINAAATTIQSGFRGYIVRKHLKESEMEKESKQTTEEEETEKSSSDDAKTLLDGHTVSPLPEIFDEKGQIEEQEKNYLVRSESKASEADEANIETTKENVNQVPESLIKIAQAEVDRICKEAEKATVSLMTPPLVKDESDRQGIDVHEEDFPAPPDDLLTSESQNEEAKEEGSSSGTQSTEPTMPLGNNTEGDSSKTEDTTAPSLAESEMPKSTAQSPSQQNDDFRLESSVTENINTEVALQRDSTEGELTMEEDSTKDDDMPATTQSSKAEGDDSLTADEEKAATVIQAGYRGFKTRKRLREESSVGTPEGEESEKGSPQHESGAEENSQKGEGESSSTHSLSSDKSEKELNDSAKKIQAGVRGYLVRKKQKVKRDAAVTIQSHFRGFKTRQRLKQKSS